jgi:hypothetical protein
MRESRYEDNLLTTVLIRIIINCRDMVWIGSHPLRTSQGKLQKAVEKTIAVTVVVSRAACGTVCV